MSLRVAYLNSEYPSLSHTFIEREIQAVRARGVEVRTFSVRPAGGSARLGAAHARAAEETGVLLDGPALGRDALWALLAHPLNLFRTLVAGQHYSPPGLAARVRHVAYALEAVRLARLLRREDLRHVHVHMANNGAMVALLATRFDPALSYSLSIHGSAEFFQLDTIRLDAKVAGATFVRCISDFCRAQVMLASDPQDWPKLHVVHCGVDTRRFAAAPLDAGGPMRLLTIGRLHPIKGYDLLLRACAMLDGRGIDWRLEMVGEGERRASLERLARELEIADRVDFAGPLPAEELPEKLAQGHALVVSSFMEGVPVVLMEAMSMARPVVGTMVGGIPELVEDGATGFLVHPGSASALADGLTRLHAARERWTQMGLEGRKTVLDAFGVDQTGEGMVDVLVRYLHLDTDPAAPSDASTRRKSASKSPDRAVRV